MKLVTFDRMKDTYEKGKDIYPNMLMLENFEDVGLYITTKKATLQSAFEKLMHSEIPDNTPSDFYVKQQLAMESVIDRGDLVIVNDHGYFAGIKTSEVRIIKEEVLGTEKIKPFLEGNIFEVDSKIFGTGWFDKEVDARECFIFCYLKNGEEHKEFIHINGWEFGSSRDYEQNHDFAYREANDLAMRRAMFLHAEKYDWCFMFGPDRENYRFSFDADEMFFKSSFMPHVGRFNQAYEELMKLKDQKDTLQEYSIQCDINERNFWADDFNMWILEDGSCIYVDWAMHERLMKFLGYNTSEKELEWVRVSGNKEYAQVYVHNYMTDAQKKTLNKLMQKHPDTYSESDALKYRKRKEVENAKLQRL